jgi:hypothetical protein
MVMFNPGAYADPQALERARRFTSRVSMEVQIGRGRYRGQTRLFITALEGDLEAQQFRDELAETVPQGIKQTWYTIFGVWPKITYIEPPGT